MLFMGMCQAMQLVNENVVVLVLFLPKKYWVHVFTSEAQSYQRGKKM